MTELLHYAGNALILLGLFFYLAASVGYLRFPDLYTRLHSVAKADNLGLGLVLAGLALQSGSLIATLKFALVWLLMLVASASVAYAIANRAKALKIEPQQVRSTDRPEA